ncbi:MAG: hypothetical protein L0H59_07275 [Tomitella sp.]|nr:hypothetical protein [Tomitella sp.]
MGSIGFGRTPGLTTAQEARTYLDENLWPGHTVVTAADRSTGDYPWGEWHKVLYAAVDDGDSNVTAHVILYTAQAGMMYIKALHEDMGPGQYEEVPARLLDVLTPTDSEYANQWRRSARDWRIANTANRKKMRGAVGRTIRLLHPLRFGDPVGEVARVHVDSETMWRDQETGMRLRPPRHWHMRGYTIDDTADSAA